MNMSAQIFFIKYSCLYDMEYVHNMNHTLDEMVYVHNMNKHIINVCDSQNISYLSMCKLSSRNISYTTSMIIRTYEEAEIFKVKVNKVLCFRELQIAAGLACERRELERLKK